MKKLNADAMLRRSEKATALDAMANMFKLMDRLPNGVNNVTWIIQNVE